MDLQSTGKRRTWWSGTKLEITVTPKWWVDVNCSSGRDKVDTPNRRAVQACAFLKQSDIGTEWIVNFDSKESAGCCLAYVRVFGTAKPNRPQPKMCATSNLDHRLVGRERNGRRFHEGDEAATDLGGGTTGAATFNTTAIDWWAVNGTANPKAKSRGERPRLSAACLAGIVFILRSGV
jgi:hypothetical protein